MTRPTRIHLLVVGAGPCGLAVGVAARRQGIPCLLVDRGPIEHALERFPLDQDVLVVGGSNSAVEAALACYRAGARVTLVHRREKFGRGVKPWILPDIENRLAAGEIDVLWEHEVARIEAGRVLLRSRTDHEAVWLPNDFVLAMIGYRPDPELPVAFGVLVEPGADVPRHDPATMETSVPGLFVAGVIAAGRDGNRIFIENGREHGDQIVRRLRRMKPAVVDGV